MYLANAPAPQRDTLIEILARSNKEEDRAGADARRAAALARGDQGRRIRDRPRTPAAWWRKSALSVPVLLDDRVLASLTVRFAASAVPLKTGIERFLPKLRQMRG